MTISIRNDWYGNEPTATFSNVSEAVKYLKVNPSYEIVPEGRVRPYGDVDGKAPETITEAEFHENDMFIACSILREFESIGERCVLYSASSYESRKYSHRWILPDVVCASRKHSRIVAEKLYKQIEFPEGVKGDLSVYSAGRKMRCVGTSKPNENRPLELLFSNDLIEDTLISYTPSAYPEIIIEIPEERKIQHASPVDENELTRICDSISVEHWTDYSICMRLVFAMCSAGASSDMIHQYCAKASNYGEAWVNGLIRNWNPTNSPTIGTIVYYAKMDNPSLRLKCSDTRDYFKEITQLTTNENTLFDHHTHNGFLKELPYHTTQAVKSQMGTGKSTEMKRICKGQGHEACREQTKVLVLSARKTYTAEFKQTLGFKGYDDFDTKKFKHIDPCNLIIQVQSIHRVKDNVYDIIFIDESETICASLSPNITHGNNYSKNIETFEGLLRSAKRVIALDAFLTDRSVRMLEQLRGDVQIIINPKHSFNKTAKIYKSLEDFNTMLRYELSNGKRVISFWGTKKHGQEFHDLNGGDFYSKDDEKKRDKAFSNVNESFVQTNHVGYTSTCTIGVNFTADKSFDIATFDVNAFSCLPRDAIQALHRARKLNENRLIGYINPDCPPEYQSMKSGIEIQEEMFDEVTQRKRKFLLALGENPDALTMVPNWLRNVLLWNRNEAVVSRKNVESVFTGYLELCGITSESIGIKDKRSKSAPTTFPDVDTIRVIQSHEEADMMIRNRTMMDKTQMLELELYLLKGKVDYVNQQIWEIWLENRRWVERTWLQTKSSSKCIIESQNNKYIELVSTDAEKLHAIQSFQFDFSTSWSIPIEELKQISLDCFKLRNRTDKDTPEQYTRDVSKAFKSWNGTELSVVRKLIQKDNIRSQTFKLEYSKINPLYNAIS